MASNLIGGTELVKALDTLAWEIAQEEISKLPPYLTDNDLTAERFYKKNRDKMGKKECYRFLDKLVDDGKFEKQERRRKGKSGSRAVVYVVKA